MRGWLLAAFAAVAFYAGAHVVEAEAGARYRAAVWLRHEIRHERALIRVERARVLEPAVVYGPLSWRIPRLKRSLAWHRAVERALRTRPDPPIQAQARDEARRIGYPPGEWRCLEGIVPLEGGWRFVWNRQGSGAWGPWQALPASKILPFGEVDDIRANVRWVTHYALRYGGGCASLAFRRSHSYW